MDEGGQRAVPGDSAGLAARQAALALLGAVLDDGRLLRHAVENAAMKMLEPQDRARAGRLALSVLRRVQGIDALLTPRLQRTPPVFVLNAMRLAVAEIADGTPAHAAVDSAVELVRRHRRHGRLSGLANAVLRQVPGQDPLAGQGPQRLPRWIRDPVAQAWGGDALRAIEAAHATIPPLDLTPRDPADPVPDWAVRMPNGSWRTAAGAQVSTLPGFAEGRFWVQDAAAAMAVPYLDPRPGERVLDLCAAPGGKTLQLAAAGAAVTAVDVSAERMARVAENLARTGLSAELVVGDLANWAPPEPVGAILLDAPCSATGTVRRHPDLPFVRRADSLPDLLALQARLLDRALGFLGSGGRLVYVTCSLLPAEGEAQVAAAMARHPGLRVEPPSMDWIDPAWIPKGGGLRLRPDHWAGRGGMDGFFMARLIRA